MQVVETLQALPGCCYLCGSSNRKQFIDTERSEEFLGAVAICDECVSIMAGLLGAPSFEEWTRIREQAVDLSEQVYQLTRERDGLKEALDGLQRAGFRAVTSIARDGDALVPSEGDGQAEDDPSSGAGPVVAGAGDAPEPSHEQDLAGLRASEQQPAHGEFKLEL